jgi:hypothetical protein
MFLGIRESDVAADHAGVGDKKVAMLTCLAKIAGMASTSKGRRTSSSKQSGDGKARVVTVKRKDALPRKVSASPGRRKPTSSKATKPARAAEPEMVTALEPAVEAPPAVQTEVMVEASQIVEEATVAEVPSAPAPRQGKRDLLAAVSQLLSTLLRWTGVR